MNKEDNTYTNYFIVLVILILLLYPLGFGSLAVFLTALLFAVSFLFILVFGFINII